MRTSRIGRILWTIIAVSLFIHVFFVVAGRTFLKDWRWSHHPVHASVEMGGALIALLVAAALMSLERRGEGTNFNVSIAGALIGMGLLDGFHALVHAGETFVWLHSTATFAGGLLFVLVWLPQTLMHRLARWWPWTVLVAATLLGLGSLSFADMIPTMVRENEFTPLARNLNVIGGLLFFAAAVRLVRSYLQKKNVDDLLFCLHCTLFSAAAIMFEQSELWDAPWWGWHILRLLAYGVALGFIILTEQRAEEALRQAQQNLLKQQRKEKELVEAELDKAREELVKKTRLATLGQLIATVSHEIRNPLGTIRTAIYSVAEEVRGRTPRVDRAIDRAERNIVRCDGIIEELLDFTRTKQLIPTPTNIDRWLGGVLGEQDLPERITVARNLTAGVELDVDREQLRRCVVNLLTNGCQAMAETEDGAEARLTIETVAEGGRLLIRVHDTGCGIDEEVMDRIFEPLYTTKGFGVGLGLPMVDQLMQQLGGGVSIQSEPGQGTTATLWLPLLPN